MGKIPWSKLPIKTLRSYGGLLLVEKERLKNWLIYRFILILITFLNLLPRKLSLFLGASLGRLAYLIFPEARKVTFKNLKIAFPVQNGSDRKKNSGRGPRETGFRYAQSEFGSCGQAPPLLKKLSLKVFEGLGRNAVDA